MKLSELKKLASKNGISLKHLNGKMLKKYELAEKLMSKGVVVKSPKKSRKPSRKTSRKPSRKPKKTSRKPMKSQMSDRLNKSQKEYLQKLEKAIDEVSKMSKKVSRKPKKTSRKPKKTSRKPKKTSRKPKKVNRKPKKASRKPKKVNRKPKKASRKPKKASRKPKKASRKPSRKTSRKPKKASRKPKKASRKPKKASRKPKKTSRKPKKTSRKPKKTSRKPKKTSRKPKKTSRKPKKARKYKIFTKNTTKSLSTTKAKTIKGTSIRKVKSLNDVKKPIKQALEVEQKNPLQVNRVVRIKYKLSEKTIILKFVNKVEYNNLLSYKINNVQVHEMKIQLIDGEIYIEDTYYYADPKDKEPGTENTKSFYKTKTKNINKTATHLATSVWKWLFKERKV